MTRLLFTSPCMGIGTKGRWGAILALAFLVLGPSLAPAQGRKPDCHVVSVGIDAYPVGMPPLKGCVNDAAFAIQDFEFQKGKLFRAVHTSLLTDAKATPQNIFNEMNRLGNVANPGDVVVLFLSGHGSNHQGAWNFVAYPSPNSALSDRTILGWADALASRGRTVWIIVDACYSGQLMVNAEPILGKYRMPGGSGILLMTSSQPNQLSMTLKEGFSAFAHAVDRGMKGSADLNGDGKVTLAEMRDFACRTSLSLVKERYNYDQHCSITASKSISDSYVVALATVPVAPHPAIAAKIFQGTLNNASSIEGNRQNQRFYFQDHAVQLVGGQSYTIDLESSDFDAYLRILDSTGRQVACNDDGGEGNNARLTFVPPQSGSYTVVATSYRPSATGRFTLKIR